MGSVHVNRDSGGKFVKGHIPTDSMKEKDRAYHLGKKHTTATKRKISKNKKGSIPWNKGIINLKQRGSRHPLWKGGRIESKDGYIYIYSPEHPHKNKRNYVSEHRLIVERSIGRFLRPEEVVHHINRIRNDNRLENLQLTQSQSAHMEIHSDRRRDSFGRFL